MADPLSATANIAAVVGLVDCLARLGKEIYAFTAAVKNAPKEIQDLQRELQGIDGILKNTRRCCEERHGRLETAEHSLAAANIETTLKSMEVEYGNISKIIAKTTQDNQGRPRSRPAHKVMGSIAWVMDRDIGKSCEKLERYKSKLCVDLLILGSHNDRALSDKLDATREDVHIVKDRTEAGFRSIDRKLNDVAAVTTVSFQSISHSLQTLADMDPSSPSSKNYFHSMAESHIQMHAKLDSMAAQLEAMEVVSEGQPDGFCNGWDADRDSLHIATLPLMLLKPKLQTLLQLMIQSQDRMMPSAEDVSWIGSEFEDLLATSHESAAASSRSRRKGTKFISRKDRSAAVKPTHPSSFHSSRSTRPSAHNRQPDLLTERPGTSNRYLQQNTPVGNVSVRLEWQKDKSSRRYKVSNIYVLFAPGQNIAESGLFISLSREQLAFKQPSICRHISTFAVLDNSSPLFTCVREDDIVGLKDLLSKRMATPRDQNTDNESILSYAARLLRVEICDLLLNEGADPINCRSDGASAIYEFLNAFWFRYYDYTISNAITERMLRTFVAAGCDPDASALGGSPLHFTLSHSLATTDYIGEDEVCTLIEMLVRLGADLQHRNAHGLTPFLYNAGIGGWQGYVILRELLKLGANPKDVSDFSENALHLALAYSTYYPSEGHGAARNIRKDDHSLVERLVLLLQAGCEPRQLDVDGHSPSDFALSSSRIWLQWCLAVERSGIVSIDDLLCSELDDVLLPVLDTDVGAGAPVHETGDWETCSSDGEDDKQGIYESQAVFCHDSDHIFLTWGGFFPWRVPPLCFECGTLCSSSDISRRKRDAWNLFKALASS